MKFEKLMPRHANIICAYLLCWVVFLSVYQGLYNCDPHHWGLMLSNAKDLFEGKIPYKDIFIQYGILTTFIHAAAYGWGKNLASLITVTAVAYSIGLWLIYRIALDLTGNLKLSIYVLVTCFLIHPLAIYPWSNYIAFPFFAFGLLLLMSNKSSFKIFEAGIFFGLAALSRESIAPVVIVFVVISFTIDSVEFGKNIKSILIKNIILVSGIMLPIVLFLSYLVHNDLIDYWYKLSWLLPNLYLTEIFPNARGFHGVVELFKSFAIKSIEEQDYRFLLFGVVTLINISIILFKMVCNKKLLLTPNVLRIAVATLLLLSGALHSHEIFRLATGSMIGVITLYIVLNYFNKEDCFFIVSLITLGLSLVWNNSGNMYLPSCNAIASSVNVVTPSVFKDQKWSQEVIQHYQNIDSDLKYIKNNCSEILFQINNTNDAFLQVLSPFSQYQIAPFKTPQSWNRLRLDYNIKAKIHNADDIVVFEIISKNEIARYRPLDGFYVYSRYTVPQSYWMPVGSILLLLLPNRCLS